METPTTGALRSSWTSTVRPLSSTNFWCGIETSLTSEVTGTGSAGAGAAATAAGGGAAVWTAGLDAQRREQ